MHHYRVCSVTTDEASAIVSDMKRNSPNDFNSLDDLSELDDKRQDKRASAKKLRRNRHYEKQFLKLANRMTPSGS
mgnify:CR=1 FL=1